jgi:hypothetical protein
VAQVVDSLVVQVLVELELVLVVDSLVSLAQE